MRSYSDQIHSIIYNSSEVELSSNEVQKLNDFSVGEVVPVLWSIIEMPVDELETQERLHRLVIQSRAFDAALKLQNLDKVKFLIDLFDSVPSWQTVCCRSFSQFLDQRIVSKLCDILLQNGDPNLRYVAAESLATTGDLTAIAALEYARKHDTGRDYEGFLISDIAEQALREIRGRLKVNRANLD